MQNNFKDAVLVENLSEIESPTFTDKRSVDALAIYKLLNDFDLDLNSSPDEIIKNLSINLNCSPDGWLIFVENKYKEKIKKIIYKSFLNAYKNDTLNFDNGECSETILYHNIDTGVIIELIDPECTSEFFYELIKKNDVTEQDLLFFELCHMPSNISTLKDEKNGLEFLNILKRNNILYEDVE